METREIQEKLLVLLPHWNYRVIRPVKQLLDDGISLEMYYCLQTLRWSGRVTMTEFAKLVQIPKHQMAKLSNKLAEQNLIERIPDETDRRIIRIQMTDKANIYMDQFLQENASCFLEFLDKMTIEERNEFGKSVEVLFSIFSKIASEEEHK